MYLRFCNVEGKCEVLSETIVEWGRLYVCSIVWAYLFLSKVQSCILIGEDCRSLHCTAALPIDRVYCTNIHKSIRFIQLLYIVHEIDFSLARDTIKVIDENLVKNHHLKQVLVVDPINLSFAGFHRGISSLRNLEKVDIFSVFFLFNHIAERYGI